MMRDVGQESINKTDMEVKASQGRQGGQNSLLCLIAVVCAMLAASVARASGKTEFIAETAVWQEAIDCAAAAGGGVVIVPAGEHIVGGLELRSNVELRFEKGAVLKALPGLENYRTVKLLHSEGDWSAVVMGLGITNAAITGEGVIFGQGGKWPEPTKEDFMRGNQEGLRPRGIFFNDSKNVRLEGFTLKDAACWGVVLKECDGVVVRRVKVDSHANWNNDGFDIESKNVLIEDCEADTGDDSFVIKSGNPNFKCENIVFRRCTARGQANGFKIGTATHGIVRNVRYANISCGVGRRVCTKLTDGTPMKLLKFHRRCDIDARNPTGCMLSALSFACVDGGIVEDVVVEGLELLGGVRQPIYIRADFRKVGMQSEKIMPSKWNILRSIDISNIRGQAMGPYASAIIGVEGFHVENVRLRNVDVTVEGAGEKESLAAIETPVPSPSSSYPTPDAFYPHIFPAYGLYIAHADGVTLDNVCFRLKDGTCDLRKECVTAEQKPTDLYLLIGQSNMAGRGITNAANRLSSERVLKFTKDRTWAEGIEPIHFDRPFSGAGPGLGFARAMADADKDAVIGLIPCAEGGSPLSRWEPGCDLYTNAVSRTKAAIAQGGRLRGILWHQGEADAWKKELAESYSRRLTNMVTQLRSELGLGAALPFVAGEIAPFYGAVIERLGGTSSLGRVNEEIWLAISLLPNCGLVSIDGIEPGPDGIHYSTECAYELGRRYAREMQRLLKRDNK